MPDSSRPGLFEADNRCESVHRGGKRNGRSRSDKGAVRPEKQESPGVLVDTTYCWGTCATTVTYRLA